MGDQIGYPPRLDSFALRNQAGRPLPVRIRQVVQDAPHRVELSVEDLDGLLVSVAHDTPRHQSGRGPHRGPSRGTCQGTDVRRGRCVRASRRCPERPPSEVHPATGDTTDGALLQPCGGAGGAGGCGGGHRSQAASAGMGGAALAAGACAPRQANRTSTPGATSAEMPSHGRSSLGRRAAARTVTRARHPVPSPSRKPSGPGERHANGSRCTLSVEQLHLVGQQCPL